MFFSFSFHLLQCPDLSANKDVLNNNKSTNDIFKSLWPTDEMAKVQKNDLSKNTNEFEVNNNNFANFSVFSNTTSATRDPFSAATDKSNNNAFSSTDFFASFNDNFDAPNLAKNALKVNNTSNSVFDAFGDKNNTDFGNVKSSFDDDDSFGTDFSGKSLNGSGKLSLSNNSSSKTSRGINKLDAFNKKDLKESHSSTASGTNLNGKSKKENVANTKYSDYSKNFESDLEEALKRSLYDQ